MIMLRKQKKKRRGTEMKIEQILDKLWKWGVLLIAYAISVHYVLIAVIPPETSLRDLIIPLNVLFVHVWIGMILWYQKTEFRDLLEEV